MHDTSGHEFALGPAFLPLTLPPGSDCIAAMAAAVGECGRGFACFSHRGALLVALDDRARLHTFLRRRAEPFTETVARESQHCPIIINDNYYGLARRHKWRAWLLDRPLLGARTLPEGQVRNNARVLGGRAAPLMFYFGQGLAGFECGQGALPAHLTAGLEGLGPLILDGLVYASANEYRGESLWRRGNNTYKSLQEHPPATGKTLLAHHRRAHLLLLWVQPDGRAEHTLDDIRDWLVAGEFDDAVFLDGSDSALLSVDGALMVPPGSEKNRANTIGLGFVPYCD